MTLIQLQSQPALRLIYYQQCGSASLPPFIGSISRLPWHRIFFDHWIHRALFRWRRLGCTREKEIMARWKVEEKNDFKEW